MKIKEGAICGVIFIFSCAVFSCDNPLIQQIVGAKTAAFESNGGSDVESQTVFRDQPVRRPHDPTRSGFTFEAWYSDNETFLEAWDFDAIPTEDITLYAKWNDDSEPPFVEPLPAIEIISDVAITVTYPVTGAAPSSTASGSGDFTIGAVSWSPGDNPFIGGVEYTATVTLTANENFAFAPELDSATINGNEAAVVDNTEDTLTLSYTFPATKTVTGIAITTQPQLSYTHGDTLDLSGLVVTFTYNDNTTEDFSLNDFDARGITASPAHGAALSHSTHNGAAVTITYTYGSFEPLTTGALIVGPKVITFTVDPIAAQTFTGDALEPAVTVSDGSTILALTADYTVAYAGNINAGTATVTITGAGNYAGSAGSAEFTINKAGIAGAVITVTGPVKGGTPSTTAAASGTVNFDVGAASWNPNNNPFLGGTVYTVSVTLTAHENYAFAPALTATINGNNATASNNSGGALTLSYTFAATDTKTVTDIVIKTAQTKMAYTHGDTLDLSGLVITLSHDDGTTEDVAYNAFVSKNISASPAHGAVLSHLADGGQPVTIAYGSFTLTTGNLTVSPKAITFNVTAIAAQTYTGSAITPTVTVRDGTTALTLTDDYTVAYTDNTSAGIATVTITGAGNYAGSTGSTTFTINKADPTVTWPTGLTATYGQTLAAITLPGNSGGTAGSFSWTAAGTTSVGSAGARTHNMTFTPTNTNYNTLTQDVTVTVAKAAGADVSAPTAATTGVTSVTLNAATAPATGQTVEYAHSTTSTAPTSGWQTGVTFNGLTGGTVYYFFARSASNDNYNTGTASAGTSITTMQNIVITVTLDVNELQEKAPNFNSNITLSRTGAGGNSKTASVAITGTYQSINWEIPGVGANASATGTTSPITLNAEDVKYNSLGWHAVTVTVTVSGMQYQTSFRFRIVE